MDDRIEQAAHTVHESWNALMSARAKQLGDPWMVVEFEDAQKFWTAVVQPLADTGLLADGPPSPEWGMKDRDGDYRIAEDESEARWITAVAETDWTLVCRQAGPWVEVPRG